ncbi:VWA domain-containing protein [Portibacter lacus]|uniref:VWFA domain-containing protein n=2 Tax=Portibacter lacus TaxID=1099794 RepID=A0AA37STK8_9BACT|nr:VWA domain-containing protein [Portibacter lacus]GLR19030.1 hypothetical protein GCM10007940_36460 [Portibacter lacus]
MKINILLIITCITFFTACEKEINEQSLQPIGCNEDLSENAFKITIQDEFAELPGQVSVFFKVDDNSGNPVANLNSSDFSIFEKGRNDNCFKNISAFEANARISPNKQVFNYSTMLVLDLSGSVLYTSLNELKNATKEFIRNIIPRDGKDSFEVGIWWFDGEDKLHLLQDFTDNTAALISKIDGINKNVSKDPSTDLYGAVLKSADIVNQNLAKQLNNDIIAASSVVVFTDGTDQAARYGKDAAINAVKKLSGNIKFYTIGLGNEIDVPVLKQIGKAGSIIAADNEDLEETFKQTSELVFDEANSYYFFEYCSPKRDGSGVNELVLQVSDSGKKGYVRTEFDATGFKSGCN